MKLEFKVIQEVEVNRLQVDAGVRYWQDAMVNGVEDSEGDLIPCRDGDRWMPIIDIDSGVIVNWNKGTTAEVHYKVCGDGEYWLTNEDGKHIAFCGDGYVPRFLAPKGQGFGDYIILNIDAEGQIKNWKFDPEEMNIDYEDE